MKNITISSKSIMICAILFLSSAISGNIQANSMGVLAKENTIEKQFNQAKKKGKVVFVLITSTSAVGVDKATQIANEAHSKHSKSEVIVINKDDAANKEIVAKYGIGNVNVPFFLVISPRGNAVAGFMLAQATPDALVNAIPSPKQDEVLVAFTEKKPIFIVISKKGLTDKSTILENCKSASAKIATKPNVVEFDFTDTKELPFLRKLGITALNDKTITMVVNASGQVTDKFEGIALETALIASAGKVIRSGCGSGCGPSSGCGPKK
jgi:hypothetical protein